jgi:hypothetical protein
MFFMSKPRRLRESRWELHPFLASSFDRGQSNSQLHRFIQGKDQIAHRIGDCVDPRAFLNVVKKRKVSPLCRDSNP